MLTLILLGLVTGTSWFGARQFKRARRAEAQLRRIASTDDEVIAVLEASSGPLAERLLLEARAVSGNVLTDKAWRALIGDLKAISSEIARIKALDEYVTDGLLVTETQYLRLVKMFPDGTYREHVRKSLKTARTERRRQG